MNALGIPIIPVVHGFGRRTLNMKGFDYFDVVMSRAIKRGVVEKGYVRGLH